MWFIFIEIHVSIKKETISINIKLISFRFVLLFLDYLLILGYFKIFSYA